MPTKKTVSKVDQESTEVAKATQSRPEVARMPFKRIGKQKVVTIIEDDGTEDGHKVDYTLFFPGLKAAQLVVDDAKMGNGAISEAAYQQGIMEQVIVDPKTSWEYWNEHEGFGEVMNEADSFLGKWLHK